MSMHILVPGLLGPFKDVDVSQILRGYPTLSRLLMRSDREAWNLDYQQTLFMLLGVAWQFDLDVPTAAVSLLAEGYTENGYFMHADPVTLMADNDRLLLFDANNLGLLQPQADAFCSVFNEHFGCDGLNLIAPHPQRWYLKVNDQDEVRTTKLTDVVGRNIDAFLPQGEGASRWRQLLNEVQMLFFQHPENDRRDAAGQLPVSGIWPGGGGTLPEVRPTGISQLAGEGALLEGLAMLCNLEQLALDQLDNLQRDTIVWIPELLRTAMDSSPGQWQEQLQSLEQWILEHVGYRMEIFLYPDNGIRYHWKSAHRRRIWRRRL